MTLQFIHLLLSCILFSLPQSVSLFPLFGCNSLAREGISFWMHLFLSTLENNDGSCNYLFSCLLSSNDFYSFVACSIFVNFFCLTFSTRSLNFTFVHWFFVFYLRFLFRCYCSQFSCSCSVVGRVFCSYGLVLVRAHLYTFIRSKCAIAFC